ncbi:DUF1428 domain-containing protein [uncultured Roseibium sp.]|uniref:DUF1428 domain-containing protein n=1 Tax=uncultured Roseibium sp. TaxID=1936171 RepID=UPI0026117A26|nr:DUF1428 domain-containing protein [uncultured Roseibium sp.]
MSYVDGFLAAVKTANKSTYLEFVRQSAPIFRKHGALELVECWGDDVPDGEVTSFPMAVKRAADETVVFSWVLWPSKEVRDVGLKRVMEEHSELFPGEMPFDGKRMVFGGFEVLHKS